ncbi:anti-virulence regulator CigR family protein [Pseudoxanthomonas sp. 10H]|uniref:anti-virulence regulator CigR family protein n=1 Tax=Pseudoxanthomonas sp. 10H TaxID=3242729 RepID=UPI00355612A3
MKRAIALSSLIMAGLLAVPALAAPPEGKGHGKGHGNGKPTHEHSSPSGVRVDADVGGLVSVSIGTGDARRIAERHGYVGYAPLPPGIRKNLARGKPLPPGIAKKMVPGPMLRDLPVYAGHEWRVAGDDLILVSLGSGLVVEVMGDIFR